MMHEILTKTMTPPADGLCGLLQLLEAGATAHADLWGCGRQTMLDRYRCAWMIARSWVRIHRPIPRAPLTLRTWIRPVKHGLSRREFDLLEGNTLIAEAVQAWILVDLQTRRIRTMDDIPEMQRFPAQASGKDAPLRRPAMPRVLESRGAVTVQAADIDCNGHLNNAKYPDYALSVLPPRPVQQLEISYCHECFAGQTLQIFGQATDQETWLQGRVGPQASFDLHAVFFPGEKETSLPTQVQK